MYAHFSGVMMAYTVYSTSNTKLIVAWQTALKHVLLLERLSGVLDKSWTKPRGYTLTVKFRFHLSLRYQFGYSVCTKSKHSSQSLLVIFSDASALSFETWWCVQVVHINASRTSYIWQIFDEGNPNFRNFSGFLDFLYVMHRLFFFFFIINRSCLC